MEDIDIESLDVSSESCEGEELEIEDPIDSLKRELKELRAQIIAVKKSAKNASKNEKKSLQEQITRMEGEEERKRVELDLAQKDGGGESEAERRQQEKVTLAREKKLKKKDAKSTQERLEREESEAIAEAMPKYAAEERASLESYLSADNLSIHEIAPDGNCMFNAIAHQLELRHFLDMNQGDLRRMASKYLTERGDKYSGFLEEPLEEYCEKIIDGSLWGGHLELDALSESLHISIKVYQADSKPLVFGVESTETPTLTICFQKYAYTLGEHYDSLVDRIQ